MCLRGISRSSLGGVCKLLGGHGWSQKRLRNLHALGMRCVGWEPTESTESPRIGDALHHWDGSCAMLPGVKQPGVELNPLRLTEPNPLTVTAPLMCSTLCYITDLDIAHVPLLCKARVQTVRRKNLPHTPHKHRDTKSKRRK